MGARYATSSAVSTFLTMQELRALTIASQRVHKHLSEILEDAVEQWIEVMRTYSGQSLPPLPDPPRMGVQVTLRPEVAQEIDRIRNEQYSRAVVVHDAIRIWLERDAARFTMTG